MCFVKFIGLSRGYKDLLRFVAVLADYRVSQGSAGVYGGLGPVTFYRALGLRGF